MTDKEFLKLFNNIDDRYLKEAEEDFSMRTASEEFILVNEKHGILKLVISAAACLAAAVAGAMLVSALIGNYGMVGPNSRPDSGTSDTSSTESSSDISNSDPLITDSGQDTSDSSEASDPEALTGTYNTSLSFRDHGTFTDKTEFYSKFYVNETEEVSALFGIGLPVDDFSRYIPARLYVVADGEPIPFYLLEKLEKTDVQMVQEVTLERGRENLFDINFESGSNNCSFTFLCILYPDTDQQMCISRSAYNEAGVPHEYAEDEHDPTVSYRRSDKPFTSRHIDITAPDNNVTVTAMLGEDKYYLVIFDNGSPMMNLFKRTSYMADCGAEDMMLQYTMPTWVEPEGSHHIQAVAFPVDVSKTPSAVYSNVLNANFSPYF